jgi:hypothetical protein
LERPDLEEAALRVLQEDVVRLNEKILTAVARLDEEVRAKIDPIELVEVVAQSYVNMGRTASGDKRALMRNVLINGIDPTATSKAELHLFVRAVAELELEHIALLRMTSPGERIGLSGADLELALIHALVSHGFVKAVAGAAFAVDSSITLPPPITYQVSELGGRFLEFLRTPPD